MMRIAIVLPVVLCCGPQIVEPARPKAECANCDRAVAIDTPIVVASSWEALCEVTPSGFGFPSDRVEPQFDACHQVRHREALRCDDDACRWERREDGGFIVRASRPGRLVMHVVMTPSAGAARIIDLPPVQVYTPTAAKVASCVIPAEDPRPVVALHLYAGATILEDDLDLAVTQADGAACHAELTLDGVVYRCPTARLELPLRVETPAATFDAMAICRPAPAG